MRNKTLLAIAAVGMMYGTSAFAEDQFGSGTITFRGTILDAPCDVTIGDGTPVVEFGQISGSALKTGDSVDEMHAQHFTIQLKNCAFDSAQDTEKAANPGGLKSKAQVAFSGTPASGNKKAFIGGVNQSVGVQLSGVDGQLITPSGAPDFTESVTPMIQLVPGTNTLNYTAKLMNVGTSAVTPGEFSIPVTYTLKYN